MIFAPEESQNKRLTFVATQVVCSSNSSISVKIPRTTFGAAAGSGILGVVAVWTNFAVRFLVCSGYGVKFAWDTTFAFGVGGASCYVVVLAGGTFKARGRIFGTDGLAKFSDRAMLALILWAMLSVYFPVAHNLHVPVLLLWPSAQPHSRTAILHMGPVPSRTQMSEPQAHGLGFGEELSVMVQAATHAGSGVA